MMRKGMVVTKIFPVMMKAEKMPDMVVKMLDKMKKIKMLDMVKKIKMPEQMEHRQVAGCRTLTFKQTSNMRDAAREKAKLASLEKDAVTPLYAGCRPTDTHLDVTLRALQMKARHKMDRQKL
jgi:hypothetical protein